MAKPTVLEIDCTTGEQVSREMTDAEFADYQAAQVQAEAQAKADADAQAAEEAHKASVLAKLASVTGLTADDIAKALNA